MALARILLPSVDVWLNLPEYPQEASGTSGMKAGINGAINLSILDGWWAEGYNGENGWGLQPHLCESNPDTRRRLEAGELLDVLEYEVIPMYFDNKKGYSERWVRMAKESMKSIIPHYNSHRMVMDYINKFYIPAITASRKLKENNNANAKLLADWKKTIHKQWPGLSIRRLDDSPHTIKQGKELTIRVGVHLNKLNNDDVHVECLLGTVKDTTDFEVVSCHLLKPVDNKHDETIYEINLVPELSGLIAYKLRAYPHHHFLCHHFETGFMKWV